MTLFSGNGSLIALQVNIFFFLLSGLKKPLQKLSMVLFGVILFEGCLTLPSAPSYCAKHKARQCITRLLRANQFSSWLCLRMLLKWFLLYSPAFLSFSLGC